jgi:hypothetical protein
MEDFTIPLSVSSSNKLNPLENWTSFESSMDAIQISLTKLQSEYEIPPNGIDAIWFKGKFKLCIDLPQLRGAQ